MRKVIFLAIASAIAGGNLFAQGIQGMYVFPRQGQSQEQQSEDAGACRSWSVRQTGVDPAYLQGQMAMMNSQYGSARKQMPVARSTLRGVTTGAMLGHIAEENEDLSERGLKMGAAYGVKQGIAQRMEMQRQAQAQQAQQQMAQVQFQMDSFNRAFGACMDAKGYSVK